MRNRLALVDVPFAISMVTVEEGFWTAEVAKARNSANRLRAYELLRMFTHNLANWTIVPWTESSEEALTSLMTRKLGIGTMDLRIASIVLANDAMLLTANLRDFSKISDLRMENWLKDPKTESTP